MRDARVRLSGATYVDRPRHLEGLRRADAIGIEAADQGQIVELDDDSLKDCFADIKQEGRKRLANLPERSDG
jgi:hypothetical protein